MSARQAKTVSARKAVAELESVKRISLPLCCGLPQTLMEALVAEHDRLRGLEIISGLQIAYPFLDESLGNAFTFRTWQCSPAIRHLVAAGRVKYVPMRQGDAVGVFGPGGVWPVGAVLLQTSPPDENGDLSLGVSIGHTLPLARTAGLVMAEVNRRMPRVGGRASINLAEVDLVVESDRPLLEFPAGGRPGPKEEAIGRYAAGLIPDEATLQIGLGAIPDAILDALSGKRDLRFFGMGIDRMVDLIESGVVASDGRPVLTATEMLGTRKLFDFINKNPLVRGLPLPETINPRVVGGIPRFCSILSAIELDLSGQVNAETIKGRQFSAVGGSFDFLEGALFSEGGRSIIALISTTPDEKISRIVARLPAGSAVTTPRHSVQYVVTEYGVAELWGRSLTERAEALIAVAHPDFRDGLREQAGL